MTKRDVFLFLKDWYKSNCDGDWEHQYGITINTLDNPGWEVKIDLAFTKLECLDIDWTATNITDDNWFGFSIKNKIYSAAGSTENLEVILEKFREIFEAQP
jgi:hypothetical protein